MTIQHTPGPWKVEYDNDTGTEDDGFWEWFNVSGSDGALVARIECRNIGDTADANLISAAPELLEALKLVEGVGAYLGDAVEAKMRAAIAKAEGREP